MKQKTDVFPLMNLMSISCSAVLFLAAYNFIGNLLLFLVFSIPIFWAVVKLIHNPFVKRKLITAAEKFSLNTLYIVYFILYAVLFSSVASG
ncbi:hypothetical protein CHI10_19090 [Bacillus sp. 7894-2]|nr:hypothetical protein CHI10_19090 [Bacillus sp. 7894-2]